VIFAFFDPSSTSSPGWPLRNFLLYIQHHYFPNGGHARVLGLRISKSDANDLTQSLLWDVRIPQNEKKMPKVLGWERNAANKLIPRFLDLSTSMDPKQLAASAVDLNLKLMRWRVLPSIDLEKIKNTSCLLLGSGTLGCNVARALLGWGVRKISFVDNGRVSFSNPARQSLFTFEDCLDGGKSKAKAAADRLKQVFPQVDTSAHSLMIPMPGHHKGGKEEKSRVEKSYNQLLDLIRTHDVIFLLTDSRESRWLPTLLCAGEEKITINAAMGFDTFVVMRHGVPRTDGKERLGCYFCNDVIAPGDSLTDRTLDQACTVTRPGLSFMTSALAVELAVSLVSHPEGALVAAEGKKDVGEKTGSELGILAHQIRGFLSHFENLVVTGHWYNKCVGCGEKVLERWKKEGFDFVWEALKNPVFLEDVSGISEMKEESVDLDVDWELNEGDDF